MNPTLLQDKLPEDAVKVERVAVAPVDKQATIEEEADVATVESTDEPVHEEGENSDPTAENSEEAADFAKAMEMSDEQDGKQESSPFSCCQGSPADVLKNLQAAVGMA